MRKLKLQVQITVDGFVGGPEGQLAWMTTDASDKELFGLINHLTDTSDTILLGRKMTDGFVQYWEQLMTKPDSRDYAFARKMVDMPKIVFSKTLTHVAGKNIRVESGDASEAIKRLKAQAGKDIVVYGGATFVASLIQGGLIDEFHLFVNPVAIGKGLRIFTAATPLRLTSSTAYPSGVVVNSFVPRSS